MHVNRLIDPLLWERAGWIGVLFAVSRYDNAPPLLAMFFRREAAGHTVFQDLIRKVGPDDPRGLLRVAIIEGDIPGRPPGYTMNVGPYLDNSTQEAIAAAGPARNMEIALVSRTCRVSQGPRNFGLPDFKEQFSRYRRCCLIPAGASPEGFSPRLELGIWKTDIVFRQAADIARVGLDQDQVVL